MTVSGKPIGEEVMRELMDPAAFMKRWNEGSDTWDPSKAVPPDRMCGTTDEEYAAKMRAAHYPESRIKETLHQ